MLKNSVYKVLVVSGSEKYNASMKQFLPGEIFEEVVFSTSIREAAGIVAQRFFDIIIVNAPLKDDMGLDFVYDLVKNGGSAVLLSYTNPEFTDHKLNLLSQGVFTLSVPSSPKVIRQTLENLCAYRQRLRKFEAKVVSVEDKMQQIRHVNQAKLLLLQNEGLTEAQAHHFIEKQAMNTHVSRDIIALQIISKYATDS